MNKDTTRSPSEDDASPAFLFKSECGKFLAVSLQRNGENIPNDDQHNWILLSEFLLGIHEAVPAEIDPEPILRGVKANGYFIWRANRTMPFGSNQ